MLVVLSHSHKDRELAIKQLRWIEKLGGTQSHDCLLVCNKMASEEFPLFEDVAKRVFKTVTTYSPRDEDERGWPQSPTFMFKRVAQHITWAMDDVPFLWMEADAAPLVPEWVGRIEAEYLKAEKPFMGNRVEIFDIPVHMTGIGVYRSVPNLCPNYAVIEQAWDVALADSILPLAHITDLIQHEWKPEVVKPNGRAVIYHQDKQGVLMGLTHETLSESFSAATLDVPASVPTRIGDGFNLPSLKPERPLSFAEQIRYHVEFVAALIKDMPGRKQSFHQELRKAGLLGKAKTRK